MPSTKSPAGYKLKPCPYCGKEISPISKRGKVLKKGHYAQKKTCGENACHREALKARHRGVEIQVILSPIDLFISAPRYE